jgi:hypothetical protein
MLISCRVPFEEGAIGRWTIEHGHNEQLIYKRCDMAKYRDSRRHYCYEISNILNK